MIAQAAAVDVLHGDEQPLIGVAEVIDADDRGMIELGGRARLLHQPLAKFVLVSEVAVHQLDRHLPLQVQIGGAIDRAHAAVAEQGIEAIPFIQGLTDKAGHRSLLAIQLPGAGLRPAPARPSTRPKRPPPRRRRSSSG